MSRFTHYLGEFPYLSDTCACVKDWTIIMSVRMLPTTTKMIKMIVVDDDDDDDGVVVDPIADDAFRTSNCGSSICTVVCHEHFREVPGAGQLDTMF